MKNKENSSPIDFIDSEDLDEFYLMIAKSFINLVRNKTESSYTQEFFNICKKELKYKDYNLIKEFLNSDIEAKLKTDKDICIDSLKF